MKVKQLAGVFPLFKSLARFWRYILRDRLSGAIGLLALMCLAAVMEMATLAAVVPLVDSLVSAQSSVTGLFAARLPARLAASEHLQTYILLAVVVVVCISAFLRVLVLRLSADFSAMLGLQLQTDYFRLMLDAEYEQIINESSSRKISMLTSKIPNIIATYVLGVLNLCTAMISALGIVIMLVWLSSGTVFVALLVLTAAYILVAYFSRGKLRHHGKSLAQNSPVSVQYLQDSLGGIRDVIMASSQEFYTQRYSSVTEKVEVSKAKLVFYSGFPRPILEAIGISSIAAIAYVINRGSVSGVTLLPMLGAFSLGLLRLLPFVQQIFALWSRMYHAQAVFNEVLLAMNNFGQHRQKPSVPVTEPTDGLAFTSGIELRNADFCYLGADSPVLKGINLLIEKGDYVGIVGPTGSGKSTLVDLLMGLLTPVAGELRVDGLVIDSHNRHQWRCKVAHVPQRVYLADGTIAENIAFAIAADQIDMQHVERCARQAHISSYIESQPDAYQTEVGENGVRLSGGQRQRLGIARALYAGSEVLVFDEATNALDKATERAIINELLKLSEQLTVIAVAHNAEAVKHCRQIVQVANGGVISQQRSS